MVSRAREKSTSKFCSSPCITFESNASTCFFLIQYMPFGRDSAENFSGDR